MDDQATTQASTSSSGTAAGTTSSRSGADEHTSLGGALQTLSLDGLRTYRRSLLDEEQRVSYWRRLLQVRLDIARRGTHVGLDRRTLATLLAQERSGGGRGALVTLLPVDDVPPRPRLGLLWSKSPTGDSDHDAQLVRDLASAEADLSAYRTALHRRLKAATDELISRYREDPRLCLSALPLPLPVRAAAKPAAGRRGPLPVPREPSSPEDVRAGGDAVRAPRTAATV